MIRKHSLTGAGVHRRCCSPVTDVLRASHSWSASSSQRPSARRKAPTPGSRRSSSEARRHRPRCPARPSSRSSARRRRRGAFTIAALCLTQAAMVRPRRSALTPRACRLTSRSSACVGFGGEDYLRRAASTGLATLVNDVKIAADDGTELPRELMGELWVRGPNIAKGYLGQPDATAKAFVKGGWCVRSECKQCGVGHCIDPAPPPCGH